jgi:hypothetical protein
VLLLLLLLLLLRLPHAAPIICETDIWYHQLCKSIPCQLLHRVDTGGGAAAAQLAFRGHPPVQCQVCEGQVYLAQTL